MIAGHFGFAAMVKSRERTAPLWALMLATVWLDVVFVPLLLMHVESVESLEPHPIYGGLIIHADVTHSLVGMLVISAILGVAFLPKWGARVAVVVGLVAASHWVLDLIVHRHDMPILPENLGNLPLMGFGLWSHPQLSAGLELLIVVVGALLYGRAANEVARQAGQGTKWASITAGLILLCGVLVLAMDYTA
jgi:membrane-bound metal-dependent hydrolase YbcI (DUF457 family)